MSHGGAVWSRFSADPRRAESADLRAGDADRDLAAEVLRDAFADGKLTRDEYDERTDSVLAARTVGALLPIIVDLVPVSGTPVIGVASADLHAKATERYRRDLRDARNGWLFVSITTLAIWAATSAAAGGPYFFWPIFPIIGVGIGYLSTRLNAESRIESIEVRLAEMRRTRHRRNHELD